MPRQRNSTRDDVDIGRLLAPLEPAGRKASHTASEQVYEILRMAIVTTALAPGMAMSEADIANHLHVSRTPVREAFRRLAAEGLLAVAPQIGTVVRKMSRATLADALFIREAIECSAARLAAQAPLQAREHVRDLLERQREAVLGGDIEDGLVRDGDLHRAIIELSGHAAAWEPVRQARAHMERVRRMAVPEMQGNTRALEQHERIVAALMAGDGESLAQELRAHIRLIEGFVEAIAQRYPAYFE